MKLSIQKYTFWKDICRTGELAISITKWSRKEIGERYETKAFACEEDSISLFRLLNVFNKNYIGVFKKETLKNCQCTTTV